MTGCVVCCENIIRSSLPLKLHEDVLHACTTFVIREEKSRKTQDVLSQDSTTVTG